MRQNDKRRLSVQSARLASYQESSRRYAKAIAHLAGQIGALQASSIEPLNSLPEPAPPVPVATDNAPDRHAA